MPNLTNLTFSLHCGDIPAMNPMPGKPFTVMDASAGSGKTRNLVKAVLLRALGTDDAKTGIKSSLALTFTNKAAAEMKHRLLEYLIDFSKSEPKDCDFLEEIAKELGVTGGIVATRAKHVLKYILHNFNDLSFGTLDSFTSRLVRTFAKDLALSENFEIILDLENLLREATDTVLSLAGRDKELTAILVRFVEQKLADERSPNLDGALFSTAKKLLEERHREPLDRLRNYTADQLLEIREKLEEKTKIITNKLAASGKETLDFIQKNGVDPYSFNRGKTGLISYLNKCIGGDISGATKINYRTYYIDQDSWYAKSAPAPVKNAIDSILDDLRPRVLTLEEYAQKHAPFVLLAEKICQNIFSLATLNALNQALSGLAEARNTIPLAAFNHLVNEKLKNEPSLYIYERLGDRYNHFFLDEFQDTSILQWQNLKPLVSDSLAGKGSALLVGDAKQSIYRWRNGEAEQFISLSEDANASTFQFQGDAKRIRLAENWRSLENVVDFNNRLFTHAAGKMKTESYSRLYQEAPQVPKKGSGGLVELHVLEKAGYSETAVTKTLAAIADLREQGFTYGDIALLVRSKKNGAELVEVLTSAGIPVLSADSLLLGNAYECRLLAGLTALRTMPGNLQMRWLLADAALAGGFLKPEEGSYRFAYDLVNSSKTNAIANLAKHIPDLENAYNDHRDLVSYTRKLIDLLGWSGTNNAFVEAYIQAIHDFVEQEQGADFDFVKWWNDEGSQKAISAAENMDAVEVATIHKSKGLQYPVVIIPFANWPHTVGTREAWVPLDATQFEGLQEMILPLSNDTADIIGGAYAEINAQSEAQALFDSLNMLYVACTRAIERLIIYTSDKKSDANINSFLLDFAASEELAQQQDGFYKWGAADKPQATTQTLGTLKVKNLVSEPWFDKLRLASTAAPDWEHDEHDARQWGNKVHWVLGKINTAHEVKVVLTNLENSGNIMPEETAKLETLIRAVVTHPQLANAFGGGTKVFNERDILVPDGTRKRPDRLCKLATGAYVLLDYKTGLPEAKHRTQLTGYAKLLEEAGFDIEKRFLVYLNDAIEVVSV